MLAEGEGNRGWEWKKQVINIIYGLVVSYKHEHVLARYIFLLACYMHIISFLVTKPQDGWLKKHEKFVLSTFRRWKSEINVWV